MILSNIIEIRREDMRLRRAQRYDIMCHLQRGSFCRETFQFIHTRFKRDVPAHQGRKCHYLRDGEYGHIQRRHPYVTAIDRDEERRGQPLYGIRKTTSTKRI